MNTNIQKALLALEDGQLFYGQTNGIAKTVCGEIVFNTSMTGYQEICTDPSYANQIILFTTSHIGNVGTNKDDCESEKVWAKGIIVREMSKKSSNWRSEKDFMTFLDENQVTWIESIDTRKLTRHIRKNGNKNACIMIGNINEDLALKLAKRHIKEKAYNRCNNQHFHPFRSYEKALKNITVYDYGVKSSILKTLKDLNCLVKVIPSKTPAEEILSASPDGIVLSNGPGDPSSMKREIENVQKLLYSGIPILGICLGCQLISIAAGAKTIKMKFGHHGANHPVYDLKREKTYITSQNHNFVIDEKTLPSDFEITHISLFDKTIQGIKSKTYPVIGFQGHPEGAPGPRDTIGLFEEFLQKIKKTDAAQPLN